MAWERGYIVVTVVHSGACHSVCKAGSPFQVRNFVDFYSTTLGLSYTSWMSNQGLSVHSFLLFLQDEGGSNVKLQKLIFSPEGHSEVELDLTGMCMSIPTVLSPNMGI